MRVVSLEFSTATRLGTRAEAVVHEHRHTSPPNAEWRIGSLA